LAGPKVRQFTLTEISKPTNEIPSYDNCMSIDLTSANNPANRPLTIWIDADAAPRDVKEIVFKASMRLQLQVRLVANQSIGVPNSNGRIQSIAVPHGANVADRYIVENAIANDLAITADIPLAAALVDKGVHVIEPRGDVLDGNNVKSRLASRDLLDAARGSGMEISGPSPYSLKDKAAFASALDRILTRLIRQRTG
jgi:uncharacterized protein